MTSSSSSELSAGRARRSRRRHALRGLPRPCCLLRHRSRPCRSPRLASSPRRSRHRGSTARPRTAHRCHKGRLGAANQRRTPLGLELRHGDPLISGSCCRESDNGRARTRRDSMLGPPPVPAPLAGRPADRGCGTHSDWVAQRAGPIGPSCSDEPGAQRRAMHRLLAPSAAASTCGQVRRSGGASPPLKRSAGHSRRERSD
jgi:hypothetical protein